MIRPTLSFRLFACCLLLGCLLPGASLGQDDSFDLFAAEEILPVTLRFDFQQLIKEKFEDQYQPCQISFQLSESEVIETDIQLKPRGNFRRKFCYLPPIRLDFEASSSPAIQALDKIKMVTHCKNAKQFEQYVLKEYLAYKMYNLFTPLSFRVRLVEITYVDTEDKKKPLTRLGFLIEDVDVMAKRNGYKELEVDQIPRQSTDYDQMTLISVFEYFLGNTDWSVPALHNIKLIIPREKEGPKVPVAVPYDFDYSGMINAPYAIPNEKLGIETVRTRLFRGRCRTEAEFQEVFDQFLEKKEALYQLVDELDLLEDYHKKEMTRYMDDFFEIIQRPAAVKNEILAACRS